jgi:long-chain-fatty-acid--[acyl-carrier-protein] ligase
LIEEHLGRPLEADETGPEVTLEQLGLDSLGRMELAMKAEDRFGFHSDQVATTLGHVWALAAGRMTGSGEKVDVPPLWNRPARPDAPIDVLAETIYEAFVRRCTLVPDDPAVADRTSGALSYRRLWVGAHLMARRLRQLPGQAIGVLLPASVAADVTFLALHRAGKLPVMLNWTTGPANLAHAVKTLGVVRVVTSRKLIDRLGIEVPGAEYVFLEDVRAGVGKLEAAIALAGTYLLPRRFKLRFPQPSPDDPAVVLFTSGSENAPKAVPLSHRNLIANIRACVHSILEPTHEDALLGFLPPFHSFGLMGTLLAPVLCGVRLVHHPDPTDAAGLVRMVAAFKPTLLVSTPTFLSYMLGVAGPGDLDSLRIVVTGAEKCPDAVFEKTRQMAPHAAILEGYGITECSPVVSANRLDHIKPGTVGPPVEGVEIRLVDPETKQPTDRKQGMLLVRGPSIFSGYLNYSGPSPFVEVEGKQWYVTGDLVEVDDDGFIRFAGRLKRFLKAGGEMISLPALEEPLTNRFPATENGPQAAVEGIETPDGRHIVLFTTQEISLREANAILAEAGFRGLMRLDEVVRLEAIPVLGTGKTDYKALRTRCQESSQK